MDNQKVVNSPEVVLKEITQDDLHNVASVHINSFPESALTKLGAQVVQRYYLWQLIGSHKKVRAVGAFIDRECTGFSFSGVFDGSISGFLDHNKAFLVKEIMFHPRLIFNSSFRKRLYSGVQLFKRFTKKKISSNDTFEKVKPQSYGILSIAVSTNYQKLGIGKMLMLDAENEAIKCGYQRIRLTVNPDNEKAIRFYEKLNWQKSMQNNLWKGLMVKNLD